MKCIHHDDLDGRCAAAIICNSGLFDSIDFIEANYNNLDVSDLKGEDVYIVDYSFSDKTLPKLKELLDNGNRVTWIDHHETSLRVCFNNPWAEAIPGVRSNDYSGAALTAMYLLDIDAFCKLPFFIRLVSDYDTWKYDCGDVTTFFKLGSDSEDQNPTGEFWKKLYAESGLDSNDENPYTPKLFSVIELGSVLKKFKDQEDKEYLDRHSYISKFEGYQVLVVNKKSNSWIFGDKMKEFPLLCSWVFDGTKYVYTLYSSDSKINCSKIAESYGGGGHKGAAGFSSSSLLLRKDVS